MLSEKEILDFVEKAPNSALIIQKCQDFLIQENKLRQRFYEKIQKVEKDRKIEFINGKVVNFDPVCLRDSNVIDSLLFLLFKHVNSHQLGFLGHYKLMIQLTRNDYEPDICFFDKSQSNKFTDDQWLFPTPDFVVEVLSPSTEKTDRTIKFDDYEAHGVKEYWIIDPEKEFVEQYILTDDNYDLILKSDNGIISSPVIEGFEIPIRAIFDEKLLNGAINRLFS